MGGHLPLDLTCAMYQSITRQGNDMMPWMTEDPERRKFCPNCHVMIEKREGHHMSLWEAH